MFAMIFYLPVYLQLALGSNPAESGMLLLPLTAGIVGGAALTGRIIVWTGRPTTIPSVGLVIAALSLAGLALLPPLHPILVALEVTTGLGLGSVMSVMQIVTQTAAGPARLGAAASTVSLARTLGSSLGASAFGALIYGLIGGAPALARAHGAAVDLRIEHAFDAAFAGAAALVPRRRVVGEPRAAAALRCRAARHGRGCRLKRAGSTQGSQSRAHEEGRRRRRSRSPLPRAVGHSCVARRKAVQESQVRRGGHRRLRRAGHR